MIPVTKPFLPPIGEYEKLLSGIWTRNWITNNGPLVKELECQLEKYLNCNKLLFLGNGTIGLQIAIKALGLKGEIITTPFSYVATTGSIVWEGCKPVFIDIDPGSLNINPDLIENSITKKTQAILATHCFGNPCDISSIERVAKKHDLKVVYDAAHCFGTTYKGKSIFDYGDLSVTSFHATKLFHTIEGGAIFSNRKELLEKIYFMRNFGHKGAESFEGLGINGKNSEFHAAMGIVNLKYVNDILKSRTDQASYYSEILKFRNYRKVNTQPDSKVNNSYFPIIFDSESDLVSIQEKLKKSEIYPRRYFYPSLNKLPYVQRSKLKIADQISACVLCLPMYHSLTYAEMDLIGKIIDSN